MRKLNGIVSLVLLSVGLLSGCSNMKNSKMSTIKGLQKMHSPALGTGTKGVSGIRMAALSETALSLGAQAGLANASQHLNATLKKQTASLDRTFNFQAMLLRHNVLPPVLTDGHNTLNLSDPNTIRVADRTFVIFRQARFVTAPPNWREYLWMDYRTPEYPHATLLPRSDAEREVWNSAVRKGWNNGLKQARSIFQENLARLKQDFEGMILYRKLLAQRIVSAPFVAKTELGVTGNGNRLNINDKVLRITVLPSLQTDTRTWRPAVTSREKLQLKTAQVGPIAAPAVPGKHITNTRGRY